MRQVLSLSLPGAVTKKIRTLSKKRGHDSVSGYIKHLVELDADLISEQELLQSIKKSRVEYKKGQAVTAKSISELL
ncbi:MAG: hypothetical protein ABIH21_03015 [Patescibacteria group bacterium]